MKKKFTAEPIAASDKVSAPNVYQVGNPNFIFDDWVNDAIDQISTHKILIDDIVSDLVPFDKLFKYFKENDIHAPDFFSVYLNDSCELAFCLVTYWDSRITVTTFDNKHKYLSTWKGAYSYITRLADTIRLVSGV